MAISPSTILSKYQGQSEKFISDIFRQARRQSRSLVFFDGEIIRLEIYNYPIYALYIEFDSIATSRGNLDDSTNSRRILAEILLQLNDFKSSVTEDSMTLVLAATNRLEDLDEAILRRFPIKIFVGLPTDLERRDLLKYFLSDVTSILSSEDLMHISRKTNGWSGSDIEVRL